MTWVQDQLDDETLFPSKIGKLNLGKQCCCCFFFFVVVFFFVLLSDDENYHHH
jgi:hypothetical protein